MRRPDEEPLNDFDRGVATELAMADVPFRALIAAAMLRADTAQLERLTAMWPGIVESLR